jgi:CPA2 family monovalent cation:H+ antiporter-2
MMVDPAMIVQYWLPILIITLTVIVGQATFATVGVLLSGQPLKTAVQCGFSLTQIGEFAFIIASLGVALGVTSNFLYPIVVAVSVVTIFLTPYMIRLAEPVYGVIYKHLPAKTRTFLDGYAEAAEPAAAKESLWKKYLSALGQIVLVYGIMSVAICILGLQLLLPLAEKWIPGIWSHVVVAVVVLACLAPFLRAIMVKKNKSEEFRGLWEANPANRAPLTATIVVRMAIALAFVFYVLARLFHTSILIILPLAIGLITYLMFSRWAKQSSRHLEKTFLNNLRSRELRAEYLGQKKPEYASRLLDRDLHLADFDIPAEAEWAGKTLHDLNFGKRFGVHVVAIIRGNRRINIPNAGERVFPHDRIQVIGTDTDLEAFGTELQRCTAELPEDFREEEMILRRLPVGSGSPFLGKALKDSGIRDQYKCLVAGIEKADGALHMPNANLPLEEGDNLWIVGEKKDVEAVLAV